MIEIPDNVKTLFEKSIVAFGTCSKSLVPNIIAVACCKVVSPNQVLVTDNFFNKTRENILQNSNVSLSFWNPEDNMSSNEGYQLKGTAEYLTTGKWKDLVDQDPNNIGLAHKAAVLVTVKEIWDLATPRLISREI